MGVQWARQEAKKNVIAECITQATAWLSANREKALWGGGGILIAALVGGLSIYKFFAARTEAWERLAIAQSFALQGKNDESLKQIRKLEDELGKTPAAGFAALFAGDVLYRQARYKEAAEAYQRLLDHPPVKAVIPIALGNLGVAREAAGDCKGAAETAQRFLDAHPDHFLAPQVHASLARCLETLGQMDKAKAAYERSALLYPDTPWAQRAQAKLKR